jgi:hypothetical protein
VRVRRRVDRELRAAAAHVEHRDHLVAVAPVRRAEERVRRLLRAAEDPGRDANARGDVGLERGRVARAPHRAGRDRVDRRHAQITCLRDVVADRRERALARRRVERPGRCDPGPEPRAARLRRETPLGVEDEQPGRVRADRDERADHGRAVRAEA